MKALTGVGLINFCRIKFSVPQRAAQGGKQLGMDMQAARSAPRPPSPCHQLEVLLWHCPLPSPLLTLCKPKGITLQLLCTVLFFPSRVSLRTRASSALFAELGSPHPLQTHQSLRPLGVWFRKQAGLRPMMQTVFADLGRGGQHSHLAKLRRRLTD